MSMVGHLWYNNLLLYLKNKMFRQFKITFNLIFFGFFFEIGYYYTIFFINNANTVL